MLRIGYRGDPSSGALQLCDQPRNFRGGRALLPTAPPPYAVDLLNVHGANPFVVQTPGDANRAGVNLRVFSLIC